MVFKKGHQNSEEIKDKIRKKLKGKMPKNLKESDNGAS